MLIHQNVSWSTSPSEQNRFQNGFLLPTPGLQTTTGPQQNLFQAKPSPHDPLGEQRPCREEVPRNKTDLERRLHDFTFQMCCEETTHRFQTFRSFLKRKTHKIQSWGKESPPPFPQVIIYLTKSKCLLFWSIQVRERTMPGQKDISNKLREAAAAARQSGKGHLRVHPSTERKILTSGRHFRQLTIFTADSP